MESDKVDDIFASAVPDELEPPKPVLTMTGESVPGSDVEAPLRRNKRTYLFGIDAGIILGIIVGMVLHSFIAEA